MNKKFSDRKEIGIKENTLFFSLPECVKEKSREFKMLQEYARTKNEALFKFLRQGGIILDFDCKHNLVCTRGRSVLAERLAGGTTYTGEVTDGALGNAVSPSFTNASTQLGSEVGRKAASDSAFDDNIAYIDFFFASGDIADGTYTEWGTFIDGDGSTPNDGRAFSLLATGGWVKSGAIYISSRYTIT